MLEILRNLRLWDIIDILIVTYVIYRIILLIKGTRAVQMLIGLVVKNSILLVDYTNILRGEGMERNAAVLQAGPVRLRPILMTAVSTIAGVLPIALGLGAGSESRAPMAIAVAGGMTSSTFLTLLVVPVAYSMIDDLARKIGLAKK